MNSTPSDTQMNDIMESIRMLMEDEKTQEKENSPSDEEADDILNLTRKVSKEAPPSQKEKEPHFKNPLSTLVKVKSKETSSGSPASPDLDSLLANHIKPFIQDYIKENLPALIEKTVRDEIIHFFQNHFIKSKK